MRPALRLPLVVGLLGMFLSAGSLAWAKIAVSPPDLAFTPTTVGHPQQLNVTVTGTGSAVSTAVKVTEVPTGFSATPTSFHVRKGNSKTVVVTFNPTTAGTFSGTIQFNKEAGVSYHPVEVSGVAYTGPTPTATLTATSTMTPSGPTPTYTMTSTTAPTGVPGVLPPIGGGDNLYLPLFKQLL